MHEKTMTKNKKKGNEGFTLPSNEQDGSYHYPQMSIFTFSLKAIIAYYLYPIPKI